MSKLVAEHDYTDAELLALWREAYAQLSVGGQEVTMRGRTFRAADLPHIRDQITWLESRISSNSEGFTMINVRLTRP
jgi:hypothetical protein